MRKNLDAEKNNPCLREQEKSFKCFGDNEYNKGACEKEIDNYNLCKSFWNSVRADRRRKGVKPHLPPPEERTQIKQEFFQRFLESQR